MQTRNRGIRPLNRGPIYAGLSMKQYKQLNLVIVKNTASQKGQVKEKKKMRS